MRRMGWMVSMLSMPLIGCGGDATSAMIRNDAESPISPVAMRAPDAPPRTISVPDAVALPADVVAFRKRRDQCDHFRGEEPGDEARAIELEKALNRTCLGTDVELAGLRHRYRDNAAVIAALQDYEDQVE